MLSSAFCEAATSSITRQPVQERKTVPSEVCSVDSELTLFRRERDLLHCLGSGVSSGSTENMPHPGCRSVLPPWWQHGTIPRSFVHGWASHLAVTLSRYHVVAPSLHTGVPMSEIERLFGSQQFSMSNKGAITWGRVRPSGCDYIHVVATRQSQLVSHIPRQKR